MPRLAILPHFDGPDRGDGGIRRVVEAQRTYLPRFGWDIVNDVNQADVVASHAAVTPEGLAATVPLVNHCHGLYWYGYEWERWALHMNRDVARAMRRADVVTAPSEWVARAIRRGTQLEPPVLYHGIEPDDWPHIESDSSATVEPYVLWNKTRIDPICDVRPVHTLARRLPDVRFVTSVKWPWDAAPENVTVSGVVPHDAAKMLVKHAALYLATTRETFGIGTLEAMAAGVPIVGWDWAGQREIVRHRIDGYLAKVDDYDDLAAGLEWCLTRRAELGNNARERAIRDFTWEDAMERYSKLYFDLLARREQAHPKVSVVMPCHNMGPWIADAIQSVTSQGFQDWELVVVDDASTDNSMAVVERVGSSDPRIRTITNVENLYLAESLNAGIAASRGDYIVPLDPDNMLGPHALTILVQALDHDRDFDIAYGAMSVIESDGREWTSSWPTQFDFRAQMIHRNQIPSTSMYRRRTWERVGGYRARCRTAEDADFWCRATSFGSNAKRVTDAVVLRYRNREDSMSHVNADWAWDEWYPWGRDWSLTPWIAPVPAEQREDPVIPAHEEPLVSVIIPVGKGHERYLLDALDSLNAQTFRWWEAIVVNDTGAPLPWVPSWARVVDTGLTRIGAGGARNRGMSVSRGRFYVFLDADDYFQPRALELMVDAQLRNGGFVYTDWYKQESGEVYTAPEWDGCESVLRQLPWPVTCLYPRTAWDATGGFDESLPAWEDWDYAIRVVRAGYCGTRVAAPLFHYRIHSGTRRESGFAARDDLKLEILKRWKTYIEGETPMPCGCGGGGGMPSLPALNLSSHTYGETIIPPAIDGVSADQMVMLEFIDDVPSPLTFVGKATGTKYRFGSDDDNRVRWVYRTDADALLTRPEFKVYNQVDEGARLVAAGPPR